MLAHFNDCSSLLSAFDLLLRPVSLSHQSEWLFPTGLLRSALHVSSDLTSPLAEQVRPNCSLINRCDLAIQLASLLSRTFLTSLHGSLSFLSFFAEMTQYWDSSKNPLKWQFPVCLVCFPYFLSTALPKIYICSCYSDFFFPCCDWKLCVGKELCWLFSIVFRLGQCVVILELGKCSVKKCLDWGRAYFKKYNSNCSIKIVTGR